MPSRLPWPRRPDTPPPWWVELRGLGAFDRRLREWAGPRRGFGRGSANEHVRERSAGAVAERGTPRPLRVARWQYERPGARWPGPMPWWPYWKRLEWDASGSDGADKPAHAFTTATHDRHPSARTRRGASYETIPERRPRPTGSATGSECDRSAGPWVEPRSTPLLVSLNSRGERGAEWRPECSGLTVP